MVFSDIPFVYKKMNEEKRRRQNIDSHRLHRFKREKDRIKRIKKG